MSLELLLKECNFTSNYKGYYALLSSIYIVHQHDYDRIIYKKIYLEAAPCINSTPECMERNMRTLIKHVWKSKHIKLLDEIFGYYLLINKKPTVTQVIDTFVDYIIAHETNI